MTARCVDSLDVEHVVRRGVVSVQSRVADDCVDQQLEARNGRRESPPLHATVELVTCVDERTPTSLTALTPIRENQPGKRHRSVGRSLRTNTGGDRPW